MEILLGKCLEELQMVAEEVGLPRFAGKQLAEWLYIRRAKSFDEMTNISLKGRETLKNKYAVGRYEPITKAESTDGTVKYLFEVNTCSSVPRKEKQFVEAVYLPENDRATLCVSTQAGCKMGCRFCMTGTLGWHGHLSAREILNQIFEVDALHSADGRAGALTNLVYMGEGEPMDNLDQVMRSLAVLTSPYGCSWSPRRITVSSVGVIPGLKRFMAESECHLAISLHNPFATERQAIMPIEKAYPIADVLALLKQYDWSHQRRISFEYICWGGKNDTPRYAKELIRLVRGLDCRVNLIRFHAGVEQEFATSNEKQMEWFRDYLTQHGITTTIRKSRGEDILAACGMLVNSLQS